MLLVRRIKRLTLANLAIHPAGYLLVALLALASCGAIVYFGVTSAVAILGLLIGLPLVYSIIAYPKFGIVALLVCAYFVMWADKMLLTYPTGTLMDGIEILLIIGFLIKHKYDKTWDFAKSPISVMILIWVSYNILEIANPVATSRLAWVYTIRTVAIVMLTYFIFMYNITSVSFIRLIIKIWLALSVFAAMYCLLQEFHGFFAFEKTWIAAEPSREGLYFIAGRWRRFSIFADPVAAAYNMVISSILSIILMLGTKSVFKKGVLLFCTLLFVTAMLYTGIRGSFVLMPAAIALLFVLKLNKKTVVAAVIAAMMFVVLLKIPAQNTVLYRFQTAFHPQYDPSYTVRKNNQKRIQPYIQAHPMGGGLGSTGMWGNRFSPGTYLASFPPDSGYMRVAVENGWIGLLLICTLLFTVIRQGIINYFKIRDNELKHYCLAMLLIVFALSIGNFPQEALVQFPINIYFYLAVALINITLKLDKDKCTELEKSTSVS